MLKSPELEKQIEIKASKIAIIRASKIAIIRFVHTLFMFDLFPPTYSKVVAFCDLNQVHNGEINMAEMQIGYIDFPVE